MKKKTQVTHRCSWAENDPLMCAYHDEEWGVPERDSRALWESLMLDGFQAGLSWLTVLRKREAFRKAFHNFDPKKVARMGEADVARLLQNEGIIRSRAKIEAAINGARIYVAMADSGEDFSTWIWTMLATSRFKTSALSLRRLRCRKRSRLGCRSAASSSSVRLSSTHGCRRAES